MANEWPANVTHTYEVGSQRGPGYSGEYGSYDAVINAFLDRGWRILQTYVEDKGPQYTREECVCLLGWSDPGAPVYPKGYQK